MQAKLRTKRNRSSPLMSGTGSKKSIFPIPNAGAASSICEKLRRRSGKSRWRRSKTSVNDPKLPRPKANRTGSTRVQDCSGKINSRLAQSNAGKDGSGQPRPNKNSNSPHRPRL